MKKTENYLRVIKIVFIYKYECRCCGYDVRKGRTKSTNSHETYDHDTYCGCKNPNGVAIKIR